MMRQVRYRIRLCLVEDLHSGTGLGDGTSVDAATYVDRNGRPVIRGSHLRGVLRSTADEMIDLGLCTSQNRDLLFGRSGDRQGLLIAGSLTAVDRQVRFRTAAAREVNSRVPMDSTLRTRQYISAGSELVGEIAIDGDGASWGDLLKHIIRRTPILGSGRRRGDGWMKVQGFECLTPAAVTAPNRADDSHRLRLCLRAIDPLNLARTGYPGNLIPTHSFIRSQVLRGVFAGYAQRLGCSFAEVAKHWLSEAIEITDALPLPDENQPSGADLLKWRVVPIPLSIRTPKPSSTHHFSGMPWWCTESGSSILGKRAEYDALRSTPVVAGKRPDPDEYLFNAAQSDWIRYEPYRRVHLRHQTPTVRTAEPELFATEELVEGTRFLTDVTFPKTGFEESVAWCVSAFADALAGYAWLRCGRGGAPMVVEKAVWHATEPRVTGAQSSHDNSITVTLTSDLIARDSETLGFFTSPSGPALACLCRSREASIAAAEVHAIADTEEVYAFNASTGLPRAPALAIRRGTAFRLNGQAANHLRTRLASGRPLGERTSEGFGNFLIDFDPLALGSPAVPAGGLVVVSQTQETEDAINRSEGAHHDQPLLNPCNLAHARAMELLKKKMQLPNRSQWQWLRESARVSPDLNDVLRQIEERADRASGRAWSNVRIDAIRSDLGAVGAGAREYLDFLVRWICAELPRERA